MNGVYILPGGTLVDYVDGHYILRKVQEEDARRYPRYQFGDGTEYEGSIEDGELNLYLNQDGPRATYLGPREHVQALEER